MSKQNMTHQHSIFPARPGRSRKLWLGLSLLSVAFLSTFMAAGHASTAADDVPPSIARLEETGRAFSAVTKNVSPAVVFIKVEVKQPDEQIAMNFGGRGDPRQDELLKKFFGDRMPRFQAPDAPRQPRRAMGQGSGFFISEDGYILTNAHVVKNAERVTVCTADGCETEAKVIGVDEQSDIAVIKVENVSAPMLPMGDSENIEVGQWVLAVGSPFGLSGTVTSGIVSATGRSSVGIADYENFIQTDAAINPGNSGGPLVNLRGEAIGINTAIFSRSGGYMGIGFAIPINMARDISDQLIANGSVTRGRIGVMIQKLTPQLAEAMELPSGSGILVGDVTADSPAEKAGLKSGDVIIEMDGKPVSDVGKFRNRVSMKTPGTKVELQILRDDKSMERTVTIGQVESKLQTASHAGSDADSGNFGLRVSPVTEELKDRFDLGDRSGVVVTSVAADSPAARVGIQPGMIIKRVGSKPIAGMDDFAAAMKSVRDKETVLFQVKFDNRSHFVAIERG